MVYIIMYMHLAENGRGHLSIIYTHLVLINLIKPTYYDICLMIQFTTLSPAFCVLDSINSSVPKKSYCKMAPGGYCTRHRS